MAIENEITTTSRMDDVAAEGIARMDTGLRMLETEVVDEPDDVLANELAAEGLDPAEAQRIATGVLAPDDSGTQVAGLGNAIGRIIKQAAPQGAEPLARKEAEALIKNRRTTNVLGTSDLKLDFGGPKKTNAALNKDVERFITIYKQDYEKARGSIDDAEATTRAVAEHSGKLEDLTKVLKLPKEALTQVETRGVLMYLRAAVDEFEELRKAARKGDQSAIEGLRAQGAVVHELMGRIAGWRREAGASVREYRGIDLMQKFKDGHAVHDALDIAQRFGDIPADKFARWMDSLDPDSRLHFFAGLLDEPDALAALRSGNDVLVRSYIDSVLLSHRTVTTNFFGNLGTMIFAVPERATMSVWGGAQRTFYKMLRNAELGVPTTAPGEARALIQAIPAAMHEFVSAFSLMWKQGIATSKGNKLDARRQNLLITAADRVPQGYFRSWALGLGHLWEAGSRSLMATDEGFKAALYRMEVQAQAERYAFFLGHDKATRDIALQEFLTNPPVEIKRAAREFASVNTFTQELGPFMEKIAGAIDAGGLPARTIATFISTPTNVARFAAQRNPLFGLISPQNMADFAAGGARRDAALARYTVGGGISAMVYTMALGGYITGGGPTDPKLRKLYEQTGKDGYRWQPYSFFVPGKGYVSYRDFEPFASMFGTVADFVEHSRSMDEDAQLQIGTAIAVATSRMVLSPSWMEGFSKFVDLMDGVHKGDKNDDDITRFIEDRVLGFWPSGFRQLRNEFDPQKRDSRIPPHVVVEHSESWRIVTETMRQWMDRTPGFSKGLPADLGPLGEPLDTRRMLGFGLLPVHVGEEQDPERGPIYKAIIESGLDPRATEVPTTLGGPNRRSILKSIPVGASQFAAPGADEPPGLELSTVEKNEIKELRVRAGLVRELYNLTQDEDFRKAPKDARAETLRKVFDKYTEGAIGEWIEQNPLVEDQLGALKEAQGERGKKPRKR